MSSIRTRGDGTLEFFVDVFKLKHFQGQLNSMKILSSCRKTNGTIKATVKGKFKTNALESAGDIFKLKFSENCSFDSKEILIYFFRSQLQRFIKISN